MIIWSYGGGRQSVAIVTLVLDGRLPQPDYIVMADTEREVVSTWDYLKQYVQPALNRIGSRVQIAPHSYANVGLYSGNGDLLLPAFTRQNGRVGHMAGFCSNEWKKRVIMRWLKDEGVTDCDVWLGISTDEAERVKPSGLNWYRHVYPLIDIVPMSRLQCTNEIQRFGWPLPERSRCWMCPQQSAEDWRRLPVSEISQAIELDHSIRLHDPSIYLHRSGLPLDRAIADAGQQDELFDSCDGGYCMV